MIGGGGGGSFKNIAVLLTANNANLKAVLASSGNEITAFDKRVQTSSNNTSKLGTNLKRGLAAGALAAGAGLAYAITQAVQFDKSMRNVNSLAGLSEAAFSQLESRVISMSTRLPQSATTLADGLYDIYSSGFKGADAMKVLNASALSASAGLTTTEVSARAIAATLKAYGLGASDAADVSDVLFQTVNAGVVSFDELASGIGNVVGGAAAAKVSIDQVGSAIATMTLAGISGAEATTSLNALLQKLIDPSTALDSMYQELGYSSGAAALETDGLRGVMEKLRTATGGNITELLALFPEIRAARGALALMSAEGKNYADSAALIEDKTGRAGAAQRVFAEQMKAASNQATLLKNQVDAAAISVGIQLIPYLLQGMDALRVLGGGIGDLISMLGNQFGPGLQDLGDILGDVWSILTTVGQAVWDLAEPFAKLGIGAAAVAFNELMAAIEPITSALSDNQAAVIALGVAVALYLVGGVGAAASTIGTSLVLALTSALGALGGLQGGFVAARAAAIGFMSSILPILAAAALVYAAVTVWQSYSDAVKETGKAFSDLDKAKKSGSITTLSSEVDQMEDLFKKRQKLIEEYDVNGANDVGKFFKNTFDPRRWGDVAALKEWKDSIDETGDAAAEGTADVTNFGTGIATLAQAMGLIDPKAAATLMQNFAEGDPAALTQLDDLLGQITPKVNAAGVSTRILNDALHSTTIGPDGTIDTAPLDGVTDALTRSNSAAAKAKAAEDAVAQAFIEAGNGAVSASDAAKALKDSLDDLVGSAMGVDEAGIKWRQGLADLEASLKKTGGGIKGNSLAAGDNRLAIMDQIDALQDLLVAQAQNGDSTEKMTKSLQSGRAALIRVGEAANVPASAMRALLRQYNLTPSLIKTIIKESGAESVSGKLKGVGKDADALGKKKPMIGVGVLTKDAYADLKRTGSVADMLGLKKPKVKATADASGALDILGTVTEIANKADKLHPTIPVSAPGADAATNAIQAAINAAIRADGMSSTITTIHRDVKKNADGGISAPSGKLPSQAKIAQGSGTGLVQWAEGETGGEAFIPLGQGKRSRSVDILAQVASLFGYQLAQVQAYASGGFTNGGGGGGKGSFTNGGGADAHGGKKKPGGGGGGGDDTSLPPFSFTYPDFKYEKFKFRKKEKKEKAEHYAHELAAAKKKYDHEKAQARAQWIRDKADALSQAQEDYRELQRTYAVSIGAAGTAGAFTPSIGDASGTLSDLKGAAEARAQATAEIQAKLSKDPHDTAADFYKAPVIGVTDYIAALKQSVAATKDWGNDLSRISSVAGQDVVESLKAMGADGQEYVKKLAGASVQEMQAMADQLRQIQLNIFSQDLAGDIAAQTQFQGNLAALVTGGHATLAGRFAAMGYKDAGALAAAAVGMSPAELAALEGQINTQNALAAGDISDAVALAGILQSSNGTLGVVGLSTKSGKSIADVLSILDRFDPTVFSKMPAGYLAQIRADQALLLQGKQPSGLMYGGIVPGSKTGDGLYYQWAESGTGGESLIPLGTSHRSRALDLWETTGRILGAGSVRGGTGSGSSGTIILPGAVSVTVDASGQQLSESQIRTIANGAADQAMGQLASSLANGRK